MSQQELLIRVVDVLDRLGIKYMVTGSVASSLQGEPRSTHDIDLVVAMTNRSADSMVEAFAPPSFYLSKEGIADAIKNRSMFNLLSIEDGDKVDFWILKDEPFAQTQFQRRYAERIGDSSVYFCSPEDTILSKLKWAELCGGSEKQFHDSLRVFEVQRERLDLAYIDHWTAELGLTADWERIKDSAEPI